MQPLLEIGWTRDWLVGLPLILGTVMLHVLGLGLIHAVGLKLAGRRRHGLGLRSAVLIGCAALLATALHAAAAALWALLHQSIGALPDMRTAMLYSLGAMTAFGHAEIFLPPRWQMLGALEALNGLLLFGLTTAFLFAIIRDLWPIERASPTPPAPPDGRR